MLGRYDILLYSLCWIRWYFLQFSMTIMKVRLLIRTSLASLVRWQYLSARSLWRSVVFSYVESNGIFFNCLKVCLLVRTSLASFAVVYFSSWIQWCVYIFFFSMTINEDFYTNNKTKTNILLCDPSHLLKDSQENKKL